MKSVQQWTWSREFCDIDFISFDNVSKNIIAEPYGSSICKILRNLQIMFLTDYTIYPIVFIN